MAGSPTETPAVRGGVPEPEAPGPREGRGRPPVLAEAGTAPLIGKRPSHRSPRGPHVQGGLMVWRRQSQAARLEHQPPRHSSVRQTLMVWGTVGTGGESRVEVAGVVVAADAPALLEHDEVGHGAVVGSGEGGWPPGGPARGRGRPARGRPGRLPGETALRGGPAPTPRA